jgi:chromosome segregation ATPase
MKTQEGLMHERVAELIGGIFAGYLNDIEEAAERRDAQLEEVRQAQLDLAEAEETIERMQETLESLPARLQEAQLRDDDEEVAKLKRYFAHAHDIIAENKAKQEEAKAVFAKYYNNILHEATAEDAVRNIYADASSAAHRALKDIESTKAQLDKRWAVAFEEFRQEANRVRR